MGRGCNNLGTPLTINGELAKHSVGKVDSVGSQELTNIPERLAIMDEEEIAVQVVYTTLFLAYPLTDNVPLATGAVRLVQPLAGRPCWAATTASSGPRW